MRNRKGQKTTDIQNQEDVKKDATPTSASGFHLSEFPTWRFPFILLLTAVALFTRLKDIDFPKQVVFDEVHFGTFANEYLRGEYFFDIHPPLGKLMHAGLASVLDHDPNFPFETIGDTIPDSTRYVELRSFGAIFSAFTVTVTYLNAELICGGATPGAIFASVLLLFDLTFIVQSRYIMIDSFLFFFFSLSLYCTLRFFQVDDEEVDKPKSRRWWFWVVASGCALACAVGVKMTGLAACGVFGFSSVGRLLVRLCFPLQSTGMPFSFKRAFWYINSTFWSCLVATIVIPAVTYYYLFVLHLVLLPKSGSGNDFMTYEFLATLEGTEYYDPNPENHMSMWDRVVELNQEMLRANADVSDTHPWQSYWYEWPAASSGLLFWQDFHENDYSQRIYLMANPFSWWLALAGFAIFVFLYALSPFFLSHPSLRDRAKRFFNTGLMMLFAHLMNWLPFIPVRRPCFLYHYCPALYYCFLLTGLVVDFTIPYRNLRAGFSLVGVLAITWAFYYFSPFVYATNISPERLDAMQWLPRWQ
eukprot:GFYU01015220.1.p1 GENE.GFYU01015220.1~~GFYU01015220.1.p1  ORF type:complete len:560 (+),score=124.64 GFYU01015220.1:92-1681(+)